MPPAELLSNDKPGDPTASAAADEPVAARDPMGLDRLGRRRVEADFDGGRLVSDSRRVLLPQVEHETGLTTALSEAIHEPRDPAKVKHDPRGLLNNRQEARRARDRPTYDSGHEMLYTQNTNEWEYTANHNLSISMFNISCPG
jgi:hypothetical protein